MEASDQKRATTNMQSDHVATRELRYFLAWEIGECFQLIDKLTFFFTFQHFIKPQVGGRGSLKKFLQALSLPSGP